MKRIILKKRNLLLALIGFSSVTMFAQTTIVNENFGSAAYDSTTPGSTVVATNLNTTVGNIWISGHNINTTTFQIDQPASNVWTGSNFSWAVHNTPIKAANGDVITITVDLGFLGTAFVNGKNIAVIGLCTTNVLADIKTTIGSKRDGVLFAPVSPDLVLTSVGGNSFAANPTISQGTLTGPYEIIIEYVVGTDATTTVRKSRLKNTATGAVSSVGISPAGINADVYAALTGSTGAYFLNWIQGYYDAAGISRVKMSKLTIIKSASSTLSVSDFNKTSITSNVSPNPVSSILNVSLDVITKKYKVVNLAGVTVLETEATGSVDVSGLSSGVYLLVTDAGIAKFIKK